jgi:hypothetical protein
MIIPTQTTTGTQPGSPFDCAHHSMTQPFLFFR